MSLNDNILFQIDSLCPHPDIQNEGITVVPRHKVRHKVHHGIRYTKIFGHGDMLVNGNIQRNMIKKEVPGHPGVLRDCTRGALEGSNPKPYSLGIELSPLSYLWYYSPSNLYTHIDHSIRYTTA